MAETDRPPWCPFKTCLCLRSYAEAACTGRIGQKRRHDELFNTHRLCFQDEGEVQWWEINDADAYYLGKMMQEVRKDVTDNDLYEPGRGKFYDLSGKT